MASAVKSKFPRSSKRGALQRRVKRTGSIVSHNFDPYDPHDPAEVFEWVHSVADTQAFMLDPENRDRQVMWIGALFSLGYAQVLGHSCRPALNREKFPDVMIHVADGTLLPLEVTECLRKGRKRDDEYKRRAGGKLITRPYSPAYNEERAAEWVVEAIRKKVEKKYARIRDLALVVHINFAVAGLTVNGFLQDVVRRLRHNPPRPFAEIWLTARVTWGGGCIAKVWPSVLGWVQFAVPPSIDSAEVRRIRGG